MREKGQTKVTKTLETPVFSRGIEILTEKKEIAHDSFWNERQLNIGRCVYDRKFVFRLGDQIAGANRDF